MLTRANEPGVKLLGAYGLLNQPTKNVPKTALDAHMTEHLGYDKHDPEGARQGNSRNGTRASAVADRGRAGGDHTPTRPEFFAQIVTKRQYAKTWTCCSDSACAQATSSTSSKRTGDTAPETTHAQTHMPQKQTPASPPSAHSRKIEAQSRLNPNFAKPSPTNYGIRQQNPERTIAIIRLVIVLLGVGQRVGRRQTLLAAIAGPQRGDGHCPHDGA